ncbi:ImcF-related family protein [Atlantibacter hermannii]|uniref:ImcF-related family protein n=1 Tax=Atlantibacter hermannii TaxID=565 RepID=UPI0028A03EE2|nr:ImcF-related family protein [Atlantibacter hermannii]MDW4574956.1 ImcF-related family protein [Atlantibacter hermannii]
MIASGSTEHWSSRFWFIVLVLAGIAWGIYHFGDRIGLTSFQAKFYAFTGLCIVVFLLRYGGLIVQFFWLRYKNKDTDTRTSSSQKSPQGQLTTHLAILTTLKQAIRDKYGRFWRRKVTILMLSGSITDVEHLAPGLSSQYWLEDQGTVLLWGEDINIPADSDWFKAVRKLCSCPVDALVWVTSIFDKFAILNEPVNDSILSSDEMGSLSNRLVIRYEHTGWRLPLYIWSVHPGSWQKGKTTQPVGCCLLPERAKPADINAQLENLAGQLTLPGIQQICLNPEFTFLLDLKRLLSVSAEKICASVSTLLNKYHSLSLAGLLFSPSSPDGAHRVKHHWGKDERWDVLLNSLVTLPAGLKAHKTGFSWIKALVAAAATLMLLWGAMMAISFTANRSLLATAQQQVQLVSAEKQPLATRLHALSELQKTLSRLQYQTEHGAPWYSRFGLNQNDDLLAALLPRYGENAIPLLRDAAAVHLQQQLNVYVQLPPDSPLREKMTKTAWEQLKLYLMLARPERMDAAWFSGALMQDWPQRPGVKDGIWQGSGASLLRFYGESLATHPAWRLHPDDGLISQVRTLLIRQMGMRNSESTLYQKMLAQVANQYADLHLADMTGDTDASRLFTTDEVVPGMFTRQAWEQAVQPAIEKVVTGRRDEMDWVLSDSRQPVTQQTSPEALKARLTERYFADFGGVWLDFLNSLRLQPAATLSDAIDQLTLMADVRQSPLVALMNTLSVQGRTGQTGDALSDSLVKSAKNLFNRDEQAVIDQQSGAHGPLDATFGPVLALLGNQTKGAGNSDLNLQTFLTRVTQVRLRLQQVTNATDPQAMTQALAQTVFQGKAVDLTETRDYGSLVAAGLGQEWSGFGQTVFVRPMEQAWQQVLTPAAESLNAQWRSAVVDDWNNAFGGRYPFKDVSSEVSLPLLGKYLNGDSGRITRFLQTRLSGVLHKEGSRWTADSINAQGLTFNPAFLKAMNTLSHLSDVVFTRGEAGLHFELRPGTEDGVMQTDLVIDSQKLTYMNQMPVWKRFSWPADTEAPGAALSWISTKAGTRQYADMSGAWGWIRLLDKATVSAYPGTGSSWSLSWKAQDGKALHYTLRTEAGEGPLALLKLRNFTLPAQIFSVDPAMLNGNKLTDGEYGDDDISSGAEGTE